MEKLLEKISEYIDSERENIVRDWVNLVKIPSVKAPREGNMPFGKNTDNLLSAVCELFLENGFDMRKNTEDGYTLYKDNKNAGKTIGVFAHGDVVPVNEAEWTITGPFEPIIKNGYVIGRGCRDNKNGVVGALYALKALRAAGYEPKSSILVFVGGNEEAGMDDIEAFVKNEKIPDISLVPDNCFPYSRGEWGIVKLIAKSKRAFREISGFKGGKAYNIVLDSVNIGVKYSDELVGSLKKDKKEFELKDGVIVYNEKGIAGHVAHPEGTVNAALLGVERLLKINSLCSEDKEILESLYTFLSSPYGEKIGVANTDEYGKTCSGNGMVYLEEGCPCFSLDIRFSPLVKAADVIEKIKEKAEEQGLEIEITGTSNGFVLEDNKPLTDAFLKSIARFGGDAESEPYVESGLTYARHLKNAYSFAGSLYFDPEKIGIKAGEGHAHETHEAASIDGLLQCIKILTSMILDTDRYLSEN